ncbi:MAG: phosphoribosylformylglycinamidine cyclo-ligase, partial [Phycisphaerales bacterium]|nr:phosphoribosylformylglycinamidine cyclo-ligase [Phycisphaerales bacterium]
IAMDRHDTVGIDLVAMNVNDLVVQGAEPLLFLDYIACHKVIPDQLEQIVKGIADACRDCDTALLGGETAEMPAMYGPGDIDLAGFAVGVVELSRATDPERVEPGDVILGLESDGVHSNGYSLVHKVIERAGVGLDERVPDLDPERTVGACFLSPTRLYAPAVVRVLRHYKVKKVITGMAHITGGGLADNLARALRGRIDAKVDLDAWEVPRVFQWLQQQGNVDHEEMRHVYNMGIGFCMIVRPSFAASITEQLRKAGERVHTIGTIVKAKGEGGRVLV